MAVLIQILSIFSMACAMYGSKLVSESKTGPGSMSFMAANVTNFAVGLAVGNLALALLQVAFSIFTIPMYRSLRFNALVILYGALVFMALGISPSQHFHLHLVDSIGCIAGVAGSYAMWRHEYRIMAWLWILADLIFIGVAMREGLIGLLLQSLVFVYYSCKRLLPSVAMTTT